MDLLGPRHLNLIGPSFTGVVNTTFTFHNYLPLFFYIPQFYPSLFYLLFGSFARVVSFEVDSSGVGSSRVASLRVVTQNCKGDTEL